MTGKELQALRKFCMLDVREAAEIIGKVSARSWQYWEAGRSPVPDDVQDMMNGLMTQRQYMLEDAEMDAEAAGGTVSLPFYVTYEEYAREHPGQGVIPWRLSQSVAGELYASGIAILK